MAAARAHWELDTDAAACRDCGQAFTFLGRDGVASTTPTVGDDQAAQVVGVVARAGDRVEQQVDALLALALACASGFMPGMVLPRRAISR